MPDPFVIYIWFCIYCWWVPVLGLISLPLLRIWFKFSWWWMSAPVVVLAAVLYGLYLMITAMGHMH